MLSRTRLLLAGAMIMAGCTPQSPADDAISLRFPIAERELILDRVMGMDHDPTDYEGFEEIYCTNYDGESYPLCYDDHDGTDFDLIDGFETMEAGSATVVAGAAGEVVQVVDEHYDMCHLDSETLGVDCDGHPMEANEVVLLHPTGHITVYKHLMTDSAMVDVGDEVEQGDAIGMVGSSGYSTAPHLHMELISPDGEKLDPYAGPYSQDESYWCGQTGEDGLPASECD